ncbi:MAG: hypothetical protein AB7I38_11945 [Dehalococcoidia bacterium]
MYSVETDDAAQEQVAALPAHALAAYTELRVVLETSPWSGRPIQPRQPGRRAGGHTFGGGRGLAVVLILERERRVDILQVQWVEITS